jgi:hypothetical protein
MATPGPLAALPQTLTEPAALQAWITDMQTYQQLRGQAEALQGFVKQNCL